MAGARKRRRRRRISRASSTVRFTLLLHRFTAPPTIHPPLLCALGSSVLGRSQSKNYLKVCTTYVKCNESWIV